MADEEDRDAEASIAQLLFEMRVCALAVDAGIAVLAKRAATVPVMEELQLLRRMSAQWLESFDTLDEVIIDHLDVSKGKRPKS